MIVTIGQWSEQQVVGSMCSHLVNHQGGVDRCSFQQGAASTIETSLEFTSCLSVCYAITLSVGYDN